MNRQLTREITRTEIETYDRDGVVHLPGIVDDEWVKRMQDAVDRALNSPGPRGMDMSAEGSPGRFAFDIFMWTWDSDFRALAFESPLAEAVAKVMRSPTVNFMWDFLTVKEPNTPDLTDWHQDQSAVPVKGSQCCGTWLALDEVTEQSGAVHYIRGSHKWGRYFTVSEKLEYYLQDGDSMVDEEGVYEPGFEKAPDFDVLEPYFAKDLVCFNSDPGDIVMHQIMTVHGAPGNKTNRRRRAIAPKWVGQNAIYTRRQNKFYTDTLRPPWDPELENGKPFPANHHLYPQVWPERLGAAARSI